MAQKQYEVRSVPFSIQIMKAGRSVRKGKPKSRGKDESKNVV